MLFSFQGKIWLATRNAQGRYEKQQFVGNAPSLQLQLQTETSQKMDSYTGNRLQIGELTRGKTATLNMTLDEWTPENLLLAFYGTQVAIPTNTVTGETLPENLVAGDVVRLEHPFVSDVVLEAAGTPLVLDTDYRIESESAGLIEFLTSQSDPVEADYEYAAADAVTMFTGQPPERWLLLDGINTENNERVIVELFRVKFQPVGDLNLIVDEYGSIPLTGAVLFDPLNADDANLGGYGRALQQAAS